MRPPALIQRRSFLLVLATLLLAVAGCKQAQTPQVSGVMQSFTLRGKVLATNPATGEVTLDHEAVPGFMEAMTMPYKLADPSTLSELHPGDRITTRLKVEKDSDGQFHQPLLDQIVVVAQARPDYKPSAQYNVPSTGQSVPDFALVNQNGRTIHLSSYHGKALLITLIYTRCPLSDFCPKMSRNFHQIDQALLADSSLAKKTHLLSISFDPAFDVPSVLESYGRTYTAGLPAEHFQHWEFAAASKDDLTPMEQFFNVGVTGGGQSLTHSLSTVLIGPTGHIEQWYPGNHWNPDEVLQQIRKLAGAA